MYILSNHIIIIETSKLSNLIYNNMDRKKEFENLTEQEKLQLLMKYVPKSVIIKPKTK